MSNTSSVRLAALGGGIRLIVATDDSIDSLGLKEGAPASALIKAAHVILAIAN